SSRRRHTRFSRDWSSDVCSSDLFSSEMAAGEPVIPFYPLGIVSGATLCDTTYAREGDPARLTYWTDHKGTAWAVSGEGEFDVYRSEERRVGKECSSRWWA